LLSVLQLREFVVVQFGIGAVGGVIVQRRFRRAAGRTGYRSRYERRM
jgi:hypothetical protein